MKRTRGEKIFGVFNAVMMILFMALVLYPFLNVAAVAFNDGVDAMRGGIYIWPRKFSMKAFTTVFERSNIGTALFNSVARTAITTPLSLLFTAGLSFIFSHRDLVGRRIFMFIFVFTMYFGGGMVPRYLLMRDLGLLDTYASMILPGFISAYNLVIMRNYFQSLPEEIEESCLIDGAGRLRIFLQFVLPLSKPILATVALWLVVGHWNSWFDVLIYITDDTKFTLQIVLRRIIITGSKEILDTSAAANAAEMESVVSSEGLKAACIFVTTLPILCAYPFVQKFFVKGIMIGSLKG